MSPKELDKAYDVFQSIPDPLGWLQENRQRAAKTKEKCAPLRDMAYGEKALQKLDIYAPKDAKGAPVLIDVHGGGWTMGSKDPLAIVGEAVVDWGCLFVPIDYGLAPQSSIEQMIADVRLAIAWVYHHISCYGGDTNNLFICGNSAGAHLAATALMPGWQTDAKVPENVIKGAILSSGVYEMEVHVYAQSHSQKALQMTLDEARQASPLFHLPASSLPVIIAYGEDEPFVYHQESQAYAKALMKKGFPVRVITMPHTHHFDMINAIAEKEGPLYAAVRQMLIQAKCSSSEEC